MVNTFPSRLFSLSYTREQTEIKYDGNPFRQKGFPLIRIKKGLPVWASLFSVLFHLNVLRIIPHGRSIFYTFCRSRRGRDRCGQPFSRLPRGDRKSVV